MIFIESADSRNAFDWAIMIGSDKSENHRIKMNEISNFEIIGGYYENEIISLLVQTRELLFAVFVDISLPNIYNATKIDGTNYSTGAFWGQNIVAVKNFAQDVKISVISLQSLKKNAGTADWMILKRSIENVEKPKFYGKNLVIGNKHEKYNFTIEEIIDKYSDYINNKNGTGNATAAVLLSTIILMGSWIGFGISFILNIVLIFAVVYYRNQISPQKGSSERHENVALLPDNGEQQPINKNQVALVAKDATPKSSEDEVMPK